ncbi:MAG: preprotein translocase subunit SecG [Candidatus Shapirobacteria bacterium]|jgi:protein translocase SecG subunit
MKTTLIIVQIILSLLLATLIFLQSNGDTESRSNIMSAVSSEKRGWEKVMFNFTIFVIIIFLISSIIQTLI